LQRRVHVHDWCYCLLRTVYIGSDAERGCAPPAGDHVPHPASFDQ